MSMNTYYYYCCFAIVIVIIIAQDNISVHATEVVKPLAASANAYPSYKWKLWFFVCVCCCCCLKHFPMLLSFLPKNVSFCLFQNKHCYNHFLFTSLISPWLLLPSLVVATPLNSLPSANIISYCFFPSPTLLMKMLIKTRTNTDPSSNPLDIYPTG